MTALALAEACTQTTWPDAVKTIAGWAAAAAIVWAICWSMR